MNCFFKSFIRVAFFIAALAVLANFASSYNLGIVFQRSWWRELRDEFVYSLQVIQQQQNSAMR